MSDTKKSKSKSNEIISLHKKRHNQNVSTTDDINSFISLAKDTENKREEEINKKKEKREKRKRINEPEDAVNDYPYFVDDSDHCESPLEAYSDISLFLNKIALSIKKTNDDVRIYDPYYCEGKMKENLNSLGFNTVHNEKEDFYENILNEDIPEYDVLVTNPPYSLDHMKKLMKFVSDSKKPWLLLLPNYVYLKDYYLPALNGQKVFYIAPKKRYMYTTPKGRRQAKSAKYTGVILLLFYTYFVYMST